MLRLTDDQFADLQEKRKGWKRGKAREEGPPTLRGPVPIPPSKPKAKGASKAAPGAAAGADPFAGQVSPQAAMQALGRLEKGERNKTEAEYEALLEERRRAGDVLAYYFEAMTLQLAFDLRYTPDFLVMMADRTLELHEVKGHWTDDARAKIKAAQERFPMFRFVAVRKRAKKDGGGWERETFGHYRKDAVVWPAPAGEGAANG